MVIEVFDDREVVFVCYFRDCGVNVVKMVVRFDGGNFGY